MKKNISCLNPGPCIITVSVFNFLRCFTSPVHYISNSARIATTELKITCSKTKKPLLSLGLTRITDN